jgi:ferric-dicitrate binding protein FerR (iron transport regulator)
MSLTKAAHVHIIGQAVLWAAILDAPHDEQTAEQFERWAEEDPMHWRTFLLQAALTRLLKLPPPDIPALEEAVRNLEEQRR